MKKFIFSMAWVAVMAMCFSCGSSSKEAQDTEDDEDTVEVKTRKKAKPVYYSLPTYESDHCKIQIMGVEFTKDNTILTGYYTCYNADGINAGYSKETYIIDDETQEKYKIESAEGISFGEFGHMEYGDTPIRLTFPRLPDKTKLIDVVEEDAGTGGYNFYGIHLEDYK